MVCLFQIILWVVCSFTSIITQPQYSISFPPICTIYFRRFSVYSIFFLFPLLVQNPKKFDCFMQYLSLHFPKVCPRHKLCRGNPFAKLVLINLMTSCSWYFFIFTKIKDFQNIKKFHSTFLCETRLYFFQNYNYISYFAV